jgi:hypothetical protein
MNHTHTRRATLSIIALHITEGCRTDFTYLTALQCNPTDPTDFTNLTVLRYNCTGPTSFINQVDCAMLQRRSGQAEIRIRCTSQKEFWVNHCANVSSHFSDNKITIFIVCLVYSYWAVKGVASNVDTSVKLLSAPVRSASSKRQHNSV